MLDLRTIAENIKVLRDQRRRLTAERAALIAQKRRDTQKMLAEFAQVHQRVAQQEAQARAAELNALRARVHALRAEARGWLETFERERQATAQTLMLEVKALRQKLASDNQLRLAEHKSLMAGIANQRRALQEAVRSLARDVQHQLKNYAQLRRDERNAWNQLLSGRAKQASPAPESSFAIKIPFATPPKQK